ncbi:unnamed protein product [Paramecium sonneborni]|uniref:PARP n=1 Tax=Paramecium sonneborni TaxID=65129 RepID=A0A8S1Q487_9CILI|nr:unnamed protein product [Paramecium sonneborni]
MEELLSSQIPQNIMQDSSNKSDFVNYDYNQKLFKNNDAKLFQVQKCNFKENIRKNSMQQNMSKINREIIQQHLQYYQKISKKEEQQFSQSKNKCQSTLDNIQIVISQTSISQSICALSISSEISILNSEIQKLKNNNNLTNNQKQYYIHKYQQQLFSKLKDQDQGKQIPHIKQIIEASNPELILYVLKEQLLRDQNRELLLTSKEYSFGFDSILGAYGQDQTCLKVRNTNLDFDQIVNDKQILKQHLLEFTQKLSNSLNVPIDQIEILGVSKGSFEISFQITGKNIEDIQQEIKSNKAASQFLNEYCNGKVEYVQYFNQASWDAYNSAKSNLGMTLSSDDFNPSYNMSWDGFHEKEQRGPPDHKYDYYFPIGCYGFGLNVKKYGYNQDWLKKDGNPNEWRIMYHGTKNFCVNSIIKNNLQPGQANYCKDFDCIDEFGKTVKLGVGIYFSNDFHVCINDGYSSYTQIGNKQFAVIFMSRVNPKKIRQAGDFMKKNNYFLINESKDVRPYRVLLYEKTTNVQQQKQKNQFRINFQITGINMNEILQQIKNNPNALKFLNEYCKGKLEYVKYFDQANVNGDLTSDDFNPSCNKFWEGYPKKVQRGPPGRAYDYYFPIGCQGFGLNVKKYGDNQDWLKKDGNPNEWRIMYHGTKLHFVNEIIKNNLKPGSGQNYTDNICKDEFGNNVKVGNGIYFSDKIDVCLSYAPYIEICGKQLAVIFMTRVNPKKIRQSEGMKCNIFVVNNSEDVRPYRILLYEKK